MIDMEVQIIVQVDLIWKISFLNLVIFLETLVDLEILEKDGKILAGIARLIDVSTVGMCVSSTMDLTSKTGLSARLMQLRSASG